MKNILLPTDFSENSQNAIVYALNFFKDEECTFYVLNVTEINILAASESFDVLTLPVIEESLLTAAKERLASLIKQVKPLSNNKKHNFIALSDYDFFIDSMRKHVIEKNIELIVMGTKGATGLKEVIIGSNAGDVITKVNCTSLLVPEKAIYKPLKEIAFPTDFSLFYNIKTLLPLSKIIYKTNAALRILHISKKEMELNSDQKKNKELFKDFFAESDYTFHYLTNDKVEDAVECFVQSRNIDLIVMVAKNLNYFQQILFHSKVEKISYHTDVPFLVLHE
ncbi:nucleotide-binding universal stress UspA family protein [Tenacibaculum adriaticum]|uniref:Nucleotide-binding universal stress UspA family protein n=1 Tax=Tenacibaculum adriaticum TaxID=413713 RepID=A0A5S5DZT9_9FLAO|nr:universal stress protein [Tenacibaculum adriaticum]TYQ00263.1 nucleotide-binding universal stress UspA family protein [Tenacibaculum adriaticum]